MNIITKFKYRYTKYIVTLILKLLIRNLQKDLKTKCFNGICYHLNKDSNIWIPTYYNNIVYKILEANRFLVKGGQYGDLYWNLYWFITRPHIVGTRIRIDYVKYILLNIDKYYKLQQEDTNNNNINLN